MNLDGFDPILRTYVKFITLEDVYRTGWKNRGMMELAPFAIENDTQHTYGAIILNSLLRKYLYPSELDRIIMIQKPLLHECGETNGLDVTPDCDDKLIVNKTKTERETTIDLFTGLKTADHQFRIWESAGKGTSLADRLSRSADYLDTTLRAWTFESSKDIPKEVRTKMGNFFDHYWQKLSGPKNHLDKVSKIHEEILYLREKHGSNMDKAIQQASPILKSILTEYFAHTKDIFLKVQGQKDRMVNGQLVSRTIADRAVSRTFLAHIMMSENNSIDEHIYHGLLDTEKDRRFAEERFKLPYTVKEMPNMFSIDLEPGRKNEFLKIDALVREYDFLEKSLYFQIRKGNYENANDYLIEHMRKI